MLPTVLRRWSLCYFYFVWLCGFYYGAFHVESCVALFVRDFWSLVSIVTTSLEEERAGICASRAFAGLFLSCFSSSWCHRLAAACDCGIPLTFLLTFYNIYKCLFHTFCLTS